MNNRSGDSVLELQQRSMNLKACVTAVLCTASAGIPLLSSAQSNAERSGSRSQSLVIEEVMVTAERRTENLQDVPIAATVLSANDLQRKSVDDVLDIQQAAPSIVINTVNRSTFINIRGVGLAQTAPTSVPGVAFYIDGQLIPHEQFIRQAFFDVASIEVLRGPQGTLTGQNSTGGAIYVTTPEPQFNEYSGYVDQTVGNYSWLRSLGAVNLGFTDNFAVRLAGVHEEMDSFTTNLGPSGTDPGDQDMDSFRMNMAFRSPDGKLKVNLRGDYFDFNSGNSAIKNRNDLASSDPFTIEEDGRSFLNQSGYRASAELRYDFGPVAIRALSSYQDGKARDQVDGDRTATMPAGRRAGRVAYSGTDFLTRINELNLLSSDDSSVKWVVGLFALDENSPVFVLRDENNTNDFVSATSSILTRADVTSESIFGQASGFVTDKWELLGGLRYSEDEQRYNRIAPPFGLGVQTSDEVTGKVSATYHATDDLLMYASAAKGYKAGGVNLSAGVPNFQPEENLVYELGFKTTIMDRRLRLNGAVFYSDYDKIQFSSLQNGLPLQQNAASSESYGAELEVTGQFAELGFNFGVAYLNAEFTDPICLNDPFNSMGDTICGGGNRLVTAGTTAPYSPELTFNAGIEYQWTLGATATLTPRLQYSYTDDQNSTPFPQVATIIPSRELVDARVQLDLDGRFQIDLFANNLLDETYIAAQVNPSSSADGGIVYGAPRQYGVRAIMRF